MTGFISQFVSNSLCDQSHLFAEDREIISYYNKLELHVKPPFTHHNIFCLLCVLKL